MRQSDPPAALALARLAVWRKSSPPLANGPKQNARRVGEHGGRVGAENAYSVLRRRVRGRAIAPLSHELVELRLVLGHAQTIQEVMEFALFVLEPPERFGPILVERAIAAGPLRRLPPHARTAH